MLSLRPDDLIALIKSDLILIFSRYQLYRDKFQDFGNICSKHCCTEPFNQYNRKITLTQFIILLNLYTNNIHVSNSSHSQYNQLNFKLGTYAYSTKSCRRESDCAAGFLPVARSHHLRLLSPRNYSNNQGTTRTGWEPPPPIYWIKYKTSSDIGNQPKIARLLICCDLFDHLLDRFVPHIWEIVLVCESRVI